MQKQIRPGTLFWPAVLVIIILFAWYAFLVEPNSIEIRNISLRLGIPRPVRIVFISDIHADTVSDAFLEQVIGAANAQQADYVLLGGDYATAGGPDINRLAMLGNLAAKKGKFAVLGNHDYLLSDYGCASPAGSETAEETREVLNQSGFTVLRNENVDTGDFTLAGLDDAWACKDNYSQALQGINRRPIIVLAHNQEAIPPEDFASLGLVLVGHTHCGQVRLPLIGSVPKLFGFKGDYDMGLHQFDNDSYVYATCGIGGGARFLAPPEITVIDIS